ncbi:MAG TPA: DUF6543 domain-containing protein [Dyella sp.]|uniref:dermonecrotic toxin domain-containing protein n=1 Tax=Dyella sp. TaxID=1869338 RepID=UPI002C87D739|nr:DUF6543 domain-containing protein [Dyella sp.]HTV87267.1 DUF6543 domain-containing protein [Dyella sp.]
MPTPTQLASLLLRSAFSDQWSIDIGCHDDAQGWLNETALPAGVSLDQFQHVMWHTDVTAIYIDAIDRFWSEYASSYPLLARIGLVRAAMLQHEENSLSDDGRRLAAHLAGTAPDAALQTLTLEDLRTHRVPDRMRESGLLRVGDCHAVDLLYATDRIRRKTVLYIPGNASPLHEFDNPDGMKDWLAEQARNEVKRDALSTHFQLADRPDGWLHAGLDETLKGLGAWPQPHTTAGPWNDWGHDSSIDTFDPHHTIVTVAQTDPLRTLARRQKVRMYADAKTHLVTHNDLNRSRIFNIASAAAVYGMALAPLALLRPELAVPVSALRAQAACTQNEPCDPAQAAGRTTPRIVFGALNASPSVAPAAPPEIGGHEVDM